jgi:CBS domain-containing protein
MKVDLDHCELVRAPPGDDRFEAVREQLAPVSGGPRRGHDALRHAVVECRTHELVDGRTCERCPHFLDAVPEASGHEVRVRCVLFETDTVDALMTRLEDVISVAADESSAIAAARMVDHEVGQLLVTSGGRAVGLVHARTIAGHHGPSGRFVAPRFPVVPRTMSLGSAARAFRARDLEVLGVLDRDELVGLVTRGDLRHAGVPGL